MSIDILTSGLKFGRQAYILAPGPKGIPFYDQIDNDSWVIAVNKAIGIEQVHKSIWLCSDGTLPKEEYFASLAPDLIKADYELLNPYLPTPVFSEGVLLDTYPAVPYYFKHGTTLAKLPWGCKKGVLRGGATIAAQALQLAFLLKAKRIILCGVDMEGHHYYDKSETNNKQMPNGEEKWLARHWLNILIRWIKRRRVEVISLSQTALEL